MAYADRVLNTELTNEHDPAYDVLPWDILREIERLSGSPVLREITWATLTIFLASPLIVTPYHIDHESNLLFQIAGFKYINLFDQTDRSVLSEQEIETFYSRDFEAARRPERAPRAQRYLLEPGTAVQNPPLAPHMVENGNDVSVGLSIGFCMRSLDRRARVYQINHLVRRAGLKTKAPGISRLRGAAELRPLVCSPNQSGSPGGDPLLGILAITRASALSRTPPSPDAERLIAVAPGRSHRPSAALLRAPPSSGVSHIPSAQAFRLCTRSAFPVRATDRVLSAHLHRRQEAPEFGSNQTGQPHNPLFHKEESWRRGWDSNPRAGITRPSDFESAPL